jgi:hypothetical protein
LQLPAGKAEGETVTVVVWYSVSTDVVTPSFNGYIVFISDEAMNHCGDRCGKPGAQSGEQLVRDGLFPGELS